MGWPLAVSAGLMGKGRRDLIASLRPLGAGHFVAMAGILLPFAAMAALVAWGDEIRIGAGLLVIAAGVYLLTIGVIRVFWPESSRHNWRCGRSPSPTLLSQSRRKTRPKAF
jgi:hypothetical protein